ncbi:LysR substrate-binding domain-containing protein [Subtercola frigoramans]|uniref:DNA-binding transcriptional LysR family regulator n=1 Tax=Subtercola frigoramans TaxID=120298 RepID=A0ABS2L170_9MICO|nr:LysR substrate-binding domain-containing protein [Subtercola frigoramans]MBM7470831.1 DNA-binding transcriptional LysR family regulator [Subtercola frigoramans]
MELRDIEAFVAVAEELHFGRAAARLRISQPPLSNRIRQLEADLKVQLFVRNTRNVTLTDAGARLLIPALKVLNQLNLTRAAAESIRTGEEGRVRLGFAGASSQRSLPLLSRAVRLAHPGIELELQSQTYVYTAIEKLVAGSLDLAFSRLPSNHPQLESRVIEVEEIICAVPDSHPLAQQGEVRLSDLRNEDFVSLPEDQGSILQATMFALCVTAGFRPRLTQIAPDSATVLALVAAGVGVTITLSSVTPAQNVGVAYLPIIDAEPNHMFATLAWRKDDQSPALRKVLAISEQALPTPDLSEFKNNPFMIGIGLE